MEIKGKVINVLARQTGMGKNGQWIKQEFILETTGQYPKKIAMSVWNEKANDFASFEGKEITAHIEIESREYQGRYYTDIKAWKIESHGGAETKPTSSVQKEQEQKYISNDTGSDDLPF